MYSNTISGVLTPGAVYAVSYCYAADTGDPPQYVTPVAAVALLTAGNSGGLLVNLDAPAGSVVWAVRSVAGQTAPLHYCKSTPGVVGTGGFAQIDIGQMSDATLQTKAQPSTVNTWAQAQISIRGIPIGPAGVTGRRVYRTTGGGSTYKLVATLADNTTTTYLDAKADGSLGATMPTTNTTTINTAQIAVSAIAAGPAGVTGRKLYRTAVGGTALQLLTTLANNTTTTYTDATPDANLGAAAPTIGTAVLAQAMLSAIAVGQAPTSTRRIYRTAVGGSALKLLTTLANNTATTFGPDTTPDASLGAAAPATDTSGLVSGSGGFVPAGSTTIPVASVAPFTPEGWATIGGVLIRYHSVSATALTGIPATGPGSLGRFSVPTTRRSPSWRN